MKKPAYGSEKALIVTFLTIIFSVPVVQVGVDLYRGNRVQFTDLFRYPPTENNLRQYEQNLEDRSWVETTARPPLQRLLFHVAAEAGSKVVVGAEGWLFYRPDLDYLVQGDRMDVDTESRWVTSATGPQMESVANAICRFQNQLRQRGIKLLVVPVPGKPSVYPDRVSGRAIADFRSRTKDLLERLEARGVPVVDLFATFDTLRREAKGKVQYYLRTDTHWTPLGAKIAAQVTAARLRSLGCVPEERREFDTRPVRVGRRGDLVEMVAGATGRQGNEGEFDCEQVADRAFGLMASTPADRPGSYKYPGEPASILALGDSFCRIYQGREPGSLGEVIVGGDASQAPPERGSTKLLPGSAGFLSHLALALGTPVDYIISDGGASTEVRRSLSAYPEILEGKKVVVWEFVERDIRLGRTGWLEVSLPEPLDSQLRGSEQAIAGQTQGVPKLGPALSR